MLSSRPPFVGSVGGGAERGSAGVCSDIQPRLKIAPQTLSFRLVQGGREGLKRANSVIGVSTHTQAEGED